MPSELRYIMFDSEEVRIAVCRFLATKSNRIDAKAIGRIAVFTSGGEVVADIYSSRNVAGSLRIDSSDLIQALLWFCRLNRIPLPQLSTKRLELSEGQLVLVTGVNPISTEPRIANDRISYAEWAVKQPLPGQA